jgi:polysaccharide biosynthesis protein
MVACPSDRMPLLPGLGAGLEPALRHIGWLVCFLLLAPVIRPYGYGVFILAFGGIATVEAIIVEAMLRALVRRPPLDAKAVSTAFAAVAVIGGGISLVLRLSSAMLGAMIDDAEFVDIFQSLTLLPLLGALAVVPMARLRRERRDGACAAATALGVALGGAAALAFAHAGFGAWALAAQAVMQRFGTTAVLWLAARERVSFAWSRRECAGLFAGLFKAIDRQALPAALPTVSTYVPCLFAGLMLGPTAAGLYLPATALAAAIGQLSPAQSAVPKSAPRIEWAGAVLLTALMAAALLPVAAPALLPIGWWGAIRPAQILLLSALPAAIGYTIRAAFNEMPADRCGLKELAAVAATAAAAPGGLAAMAAAAVAGASLVTLLSLWPLRRVACPDWGAAGSAAARSAAAVGGAALPVFALAEPLGTALDPSLACCLLIAAGWLCFLVVRGSNIGSAAPTPRRRSAAPAARVRAA